MRATPPIQPGLKLEVPLTLCGESRTVADHFGEAGHGQSISYDEGVQEPSHDANAFNVG